MHYNFKRDINDGKRGEAMVKAWLEMEGGSVDEIPPKQYSGDLRHCNLNYEVKYDIMSRTTGNLCFEIANGKGETTGIASTEADYVVYVFPTEEGHSLYCFERQALYDWLFDPIANHRVVSGGDRKKYSMILVPKTTFENLIIGGANWLKKAVLDA